MKKALCCDKAPCRMQHLDTFEAMTAVTLQFLPHNAQYQADVTVTPNYRRGPGDMEIDALTKKGKGYKGKGKTSCFVCGRVGHVAQDGWFKETYKCSAPNNKGKKGRDRGKNSVNEATTVCTSASQMSSHPGRHL